MMRIFSAIRQVFGKQILILSLMSLLIVSSLFIFSTQPAFADRHLNKSLSSEAVSDHTYKFSEEAGLPEESREQAYEEATQAVADPKEGLEKIYEEDLKAYKKENPGENSLIESAKQVVEKVTGKE